MAQTFEGFLAAQERRVQKALDTSERHLREKLRDIEEDQVSDIFTDLLAYDVVRRITGHHTGARKPNLSELDGDFS